MYNPFKDIKNVKEIIDWLNEEYPHPLGERYFLAYFVKEDKLPIWHIACNDYWFYHKNQDLSISIEAAREAFPNTKMILCVLNWLDNWKIKKDKTVAPGKSVIIVR